MEIEVKNKIMGVDKKNKNNGNKGRKIPLLLEMRENNTCSKQCNVIFVKIENENGDEVLLSLKYILIYHIFILCC